MKTVLLVGLGSALGGVGRHAIQTWLGRRFPGPLPWGTIAVNVAGSFVIGFLAGWMRNGGEILSQDQRQLLLTGLLGGFTTFSSFSLQTFVLARDGLWGPAAINVLGSLFTCLAAVTMGAWSARWIST